MLEILVVNIKIVTQGKILRLKLDYFDYFPTSDFFQLSLGIFFFGCECMPSFVMAARLDSFSF